MSSHLPNTLNQSDWMTSLEVESTASHTNHVLRSPSADGLIHDSESEPPEPLISVPPHPSKRQHIYEGNSSEVQEAESPIPETSIKKCDRNASNIPHERVQSWTKESQSDETNVNKPGLKAATVTLTAATVFQHHHHHHKKNDTPLVPTRTAIDVGIQDAVANLEDDPDEEPIDEQARFERVTAAQQRAGAILGSADDGEAIEIGSVNNILFWMAANFLVMWGIIFFNNNYWSPWLYFIFLLAHWIYFYVVPAQKRWKFKTLAQFFALEDEIAAGMIHHLIPVMMLAIVTSMTILELCIIYVWPAELPGITREALQFYTERVQAHPSWPTDSPENAAQLLAAYSFGQCMTTSAAGMFVLYAATRTILGKRGQKCLLERRAFLGKYHTSRGTGVAIFKLIENLEAIARKRVLKRWSVGKRAAVITLSLVNSLLMFIFQHKVVSMAWSVAPGLTILYLLSCLTVGFPGSMLICVALDFVTSFFLESAEWMNQLRFVDLDLTDVTDLLCWQEMRNYYLRWKLPVQYACAQLGFATCLVITLCVYTSMILLLFLQGVNVLYISGVQMAWFIASVAAVFLIQCLVAATSVWDAQQTHLALLDDIILKLRFRQSLTSTPQLQRYTQQYRLDEVTQSWDNSTEKSRTIQPRDWLPTVEDDDSEHVELNREGIDGERGERDHEVTKFDEDSSLKPVTTNSTAIKIVSSTEMAGLSATTEKVSSLSPNRTLITRPSLTSSPSLDRSGGVFSTRSSLRRTAAGSHRYNHAYMDRMILTLQGQMAQIEKFDPAPEIFGISVKPTLLRVMAGYVVSAVAVIVTKFLTTV